MNYRIQFSDLVTALTARRVRDGMELPNLPVPGALLAIEMRSPPAAFSTALLISLSSFPLLHGRRVSGIGKLHLSATRAPAPTERYDAAQ
jgi:hypothetical protein